MFFPAKVASKKITFDTGTVFKMKWIDGADFLSHSCAAAQTLLPKTKFENGIFVSKGKSIITPGLARQITQRDSELLAATMNVRNFDSIEECLFSDKQVSKAISVLST